MDEIISLILHGCELARELGETLPNLATQPNSLFNSLEEITKIFGSAKERVLHSQDSSSSSYLHNTLTLEHQQNGISVEQWLRSNPQAMDIIQTQLVADQNEAKISGGIDIRGSEAAVRGSQAVDVVPASDVNIASSSSQRPRRRFVYLQNLRDYIMRLLNMTLICACIRKNIMLNYRHTNKTTP